MPCVPVTLFETLQVLLPGSSAFATPAVRKRNLLTQLSEHDSFRLSATLDCGVRPSGDGIREKQMGDYTVARLISPACLRLSEAGVFWPCLFRSSTQLQICVRLWNLTVVA